MYSTYPEVKKFTYPILEMAAKDKGLTVEEYRLGTLKRCECEIMNLVETANLLPEEQEVMRDLALQVRIAIASD